MADVNAGAETLVRHAGYTAEMYLQQALKSIDECFGEGYAKAHPELVAAFMQSAARDFHSSMLKASAQDIRNALDNVANAVLDRES